MKVWHDKLNLKLSGTNYQQNVNRNDAYFLTIFIEWEIPITDLFAVQFVLNKQFLQIQNW